MGKSNFTSVLVSKWVPSKIKDLDLGVLAFTTDVHRLAVVKGPKDTRALVNSGRIERIDTAHYRVTFGGGAVRYAKRRHYENLAHPGTLLYLESSGDTIARNGIARYLRAS